MVGIYKIQNKINGKCYIGQSIHIKTRWKEHIKSSKNRNSSSLISKAIRKYGVENFSFEIIELCKINKLDEREIYWIKQFNSFHNGYNMTLGGESGYKYNPNTIYDIYLQTKNISATARQVGCCENVVRNAVDLFGVDRKSTAKRPVEKIDPITLEIVESYESLYDAKNKTGFSIDTIRSAAEGNTTNCGGFFWRFKGDNAKQFTPIKKLAKREILQLDNDGNILAEYKSISDACRILGLNPKSSSPSINRVCKGERKTAYGYKWKYKENQ